MPLVGPSGSEVTSKKAEEKGSTMTDFKVGDKVRYPGGSGNVVSEPYNGKVRVVGPGGIVFPVKISEIMSSDRTLAEKRADDRKVLEEASRPWRTAPDYYKFPHDVQTTDISMHLNSNGGQAVGYISRSTRIDGQNKEDDPRESLRKAIDLIQMEIYRLDEKFGIST